MMPVKLASRMIEQKYRGKPHVNLAFPFREYRKYLHIK
jgi:hypothetical protein